MKLLEEKRGDLWDTDSDMDFLVSSTSEVQAIKVEVTSSRSSPMKVNNQLKKTTEKWDKYLRTIYPTRDSYTEHKGSSNTTQKNNKNWF